MKTSKCKTAIVVDRLDSALGITALSRANLIGDIEVIPALTFLTPNSLIRTISSGGYECVLFSWREILFYLYSDYFTSKKLELIRKRVRIGASIPDYQGLCSDYSKLNEKELYILSRVDFYHVTNKHLADTYESLFPSSKFAGVLHDIPNLSLIKRIKLQSHKRDLKQLIWVGNSEWGNRSGFEDYKGFYNIVLPLNNELQESTGMKLFIIDSSRNRLPNTQVLAEIAKSRCLILASTQEGTALPILESLALGTAVISTNVGISPEIKNETLDFQIVGRSVESFLSAIELLPDIPEDKSSQESFDYYLEVALAERIDFAHHSELTRNTPDFNFSQSFQFYLKWLLRYIKNLGKC